MVQLIMFRLQIHILSSFSAIKYNIRYHISANIAREVIEWLEPIKNN